MRLVVYDADGKAHAFTSKNGTDKFVVVAANMDTHECVTSVGADPSFVLFALHQLTEVLIREAENSCDGSGIRFALDIVHNVIKRLIKEATVEYGAGEDTEGDSNDDVDSIAG